MRSLRSIAVMGMMLLVTLASAQTQKQRSTTRAAVKAKKVLLEKNPELDSLFDSSAGYAIFPNVGKVGFVVGGSSGKGVLVENGMLSGMVDLKKLDVGMQAGVQSTVEVIFFESEADVRDFKEGKFEFGAQVSAVALKSGVSINAKYTEGVAVYVYPKSGLMADASVGGQKFNFKQI